MAETKLTKAQRRALESLGRPNIHGCSWGDSYKPPHILVREGLAREEGRLQGRPYYRITPAGHAALNPEGKP